MGVWIETAQVGFVIPEAFCHTLYGCVDWNPFKDKAGWRLAGHTLYGCVDWNVDGADKINVALGSHPVWVCGLKPFSSVQELKLNWSHPVWVCGLKPR